jgi:hypothetical protein
LTHSAGAEWPVVAAVGARCPTAHAAGSKESRIIPIMILAYALAMKELEVTCVSNVVAANSVLFAVSEGHLQTTARSLVTKLQPLSLHKTRAEVPI